MESICENIGVENRVHKEHITTIYMNKLDLITTIKIIKVGVLF